MCPPIGLDHCSPRAFELHSGEKSRTSPAVTCFSMPLSAIIVDNKFTIFRVQEKRRNRKKLEVKVRFLGKPFLYGVLALLY